MLITKAEAARLEAAHDDELLEKMVKAGGQALADITKGD